MPTQHATFSSRVYLFTSILNLLLFSSIFSINAFSDGKVKYGLAIFTKDDSFQIGFTSEQTRDMWLADMHTLSHSTTKHSHNTVGM